VSRRIDVEVEQLRAELERSHGFIARAARSLGVHRLTLRRRVIEAGLESVALSMRQATGWTSGAPRVTS